MPAQAKMRPISKNKLNVVWTTLEDHGSRPVWAKVKTLSENKLKKEKSLGA
jgi:hypothetical protein